MALEPKNIPLKGLFPLPDGLEDAPVEARAAFWRLIGEEALRLKRREILAGVDRFGVKFLPVKRKWGDPTPLIPHGEDSRTYRLLSLNSTAQGATLFWRSGGRVSWKTILGYHAYKHGPRSLPVRDELGLSPKSSRTLEEKSSFIWETIRPREPRRRPKPVPKIKVKALPMSATSKEGDRRQMEEADRLTREAMAESRAIMQELTARRFNINIVGDPGKIGRHDIDAIYEQIAKMPTEVMDKTAKSGKKFDIVVGYGITDHPNFAHYKGKIPRGWETTRKTWDDVPGAGGSRTIIVASRLYSGHGSTNIVLHEHAHTYDSASGYPSEDEEWRSIHSSVEWGDVYLEIPEEGYAESFARYFHGRSTRESLPEAVRNYWKERFGE